MKIYYNDNGFQLGNLLYVLLQAYQDRFLKAENNFVLQAGYSKFCQLFFPNTKELFTKANGGWVESPAYFQKWGEDFSSEVLDEFCRTYLLDSVQELTRSIPEKNITIAIRRTDFLAPERAKFYGYDALTYIKDCLWEIERLEKDYFSQLTIRITTDDVNWCRETLVSFLQEEFTFEQPIVVEKQHIRDNFLQLYACDRYFISPNSTYCYWVAYLLRVSKEHVIVFAPDFNTSLIEGGRQIADTRGWRLIPVDRSAYVEDIHPRVAILLPIGDVDGLEDTLQSIKHQGFQDFKIIAIFNGLEKDESYFRIFSKDQYSCLEIKDRGISQALNAGIAYSSSEFLARIDVGDLWRENHLDILYTYLQNHPEIDFVSSQRVGYWDCSDLPQLDNPLEISSVLSPYELSQKLLIVNYITHSSVLFKRSLLGEHRYDKTFNGMEDWKLWVELITDSNSAWLNQTTVYYQQNLISLDEKYLNRFETHLKLLDYIKQSKKISNYDYVQLRRKYLGQ